MAAALSSGVGDCRRGGRRLRRARNAARGAVHVGAEALSFDGTLRSSPAARKRTRLAGVNARFDQLKEGATRV